MYATAFAARAKLIVALGDAPERTKLVNGASERAGLRVV